MLYGAEAVAYLVQRLTRACLINSNGSALFLSPNSFARRSRKPYQRVGKLILSIMALFKITMKREAAGVRSSSGMKVPKGVTFQVVSKNSSKPTGKEIADAIKLQFGIEVHEGDFYDQGFFGRIKVEKM